MHEAHCPTNGFSNTVPFDCLALMTLVFSDCTMSRGNRFMRWDIMLSGMGMLEKRGNISSGGGKKTEGWGTKTLGT